MNKPEKFRKLTEQDIKEYEQKKLTQPAKPLRHFVATHMQTKKKADFFYESLNQAKYLNPWFKEWHEVFR